MADLDRRVLDRFEPLFVRMPAPLDARCELLLPLLRDSAWR